MYLSLFTNQIPHSFRNLFCHIVNLICNCVVRPIYGCIYDRLLHLHTICIEEHGSGFSRVRSPLIGICAYVFARQKSNQYSSNNVGSYNKHLVVSGFAGNERINYFQSSLPKICQQPTQWAVFGPLGFFCTTAVVIAETAGIICNR